MKFKSLTRTLIGAVLILSLLMMPTAVFAAEEGSATGSFAVGNASPSVTSVQLWTTGSPATTTSMTPQVEFNVKVAVSDANTLADIDTVTVRIFYDADGTYAGGDEAGAADTQTLAILTWTNPATFAIDPSASTSWTTETSVTPTLTASSGTFEFHFKPGMVSTETPGTERWHVYAIADDGTATATGTDENKTMNWYGELTVNTASVDWGALAAGVDFEATDTDETGISVTYISNGDYDEQIASSAAWTSAGSDATLDVTGATASANEFSLKADDSTTFASAVLVTASTTYVTLDDTGAQTAEAGDTVTANTIWLKLASTFENYTYSGSIYYKILDGS